MIEPEARGPQGSEPEAGDWREAGTLPAMPPLRPKRGSAPRAPEPTSQSGRREASSGTALIEREAKERVRMFRGLLLLALVVLALSFLRAGWERVFVPGWWRQW